jgi:hypothetical protein
VPPLTHCSSPSARAGRDGRRLEPAAASSDDDEQGGALSLRKRWQVAARWGERAKPTPTVAGSSTAGQGARGGGRCAQEEREERRLSV